MHGRPRKPAKPEDTVASSRKADHLRSLLSQLLHNHHNLIYSDEALESSGKLLEINPESYTAWNYRKLAVEHLIKNSTSDSDSQPDSDFIKSILDKELRIVELALRQNCKAYGAWHHRKWVLSKGYSSVDNEFRLLEKLLKVDARNFHAWNYRRLVVALKNISDEEELQFTTDMINMNFSNYSAWHNRSTLLSHLLKKRVPGFFPMEKCLPEEYELVHQALFTDPDDQSGWFHHLWLLYQTVRTDSPVLVSSWPAHGSDLVLSLDRCMDSSDLSPFTSFHSNSEAFPLILYFSQPVQGVNSSTVTVDTVFNSNKDLIWKPLSENNSKTAQAWVTHLKFPDVKVHSLKSYPVEVVIGDSQGIICSSGFQFSKFYQFAFTVRVEPLGSEHAEKKDIERISWRDENFHVHNARLSESSSFVSFDRLSMKTDHEPTVSKWHVKTIANEIALFRELLSEIDCKIGKLTLARLLTAYDAIMLCNNDPAENKVHTDEVLELYNDLMKLDPPHFRYYKDEHSLVLMQKVTSTSESLLQHCQKYTDSSFPNEGGPLCLRLNSLSLSRLGSLENLMWVQMLDLSHNELQSIEGLEALQLLSRLNLSKNKIASFTALEPLKLLKSLEVLDISYNVIGVHSIDTRRYLCSSPLSHSFRSDWNVDELVIDGVKVINYWDAHLIFKGLNLTQLDVVGNSIADEKFRSFLLKVLPQLKWLDGEKLH